MKPPVLFANLSRGWGGGEVWHCTLAGALAGRGWPVALLVWPGGELQRRAEAAGLACHPMRLRTASLLNPLAMGRLTRLLRELAPGAAILNASRELKVVGWAARRAGVPRVIFRRGIPQPIGRNALNRWFLRHVATRLIVNSRATLEAMQAAFPREVAALEPAVIYNGIDPGAWKRHTPPAGQRRIGAVGRLTQEKGMDRLIAALPAVRQQVPEARLRIVGDGPERPALERQAAALGLADAVEFAGRSQDVAAHLSACDVFCLPSRWEGFGYVLLEAMLLRLPCVAFDISAAREIVLPGETGLLVADGDVLALGEALAGLLADPGRARELGAAGHERAITEFPLSRAVDQLERVLEA